MILTLLATALIRTPYAHWARSNRVDDDRRDRGEKILLVLVTLGMMALPPGCALTNWFHPADYGFFEPAAWSGALISIPALMLFWRSHADLGRHWSMTLELHDHHSIVNKGIYRHIRHPMYASVWLYCVVQALLIQNWIVGPAGFVSFALLYWIRVPREEAMMRDRFGTEYLAYTAATPRLLPQVLRRRSD